MSDKLKVDTSMLNRDISKIKQNINAARNALDEMQTAVSALNAMWEGDAANIFQAQFTSDHEMMIEVLNSLKKYSGSLENANLQYVNTFGRVSELINSLNV